MTRWKQRAAVLVAGACMALALPALQPAASAQTPSDPGAGGEVFPVTPTRILDTRNPALDVAPFGAKPSSLPTPTGPTFDLKLTGRDLVPESDVLAVIATVTVVAPSQSGYLAIRPKGAGQSDPPTSLVNFEVGQTVPNLAIVGVSSSGEVEIELVTSGGRSNVHVLVDVYGWVATSGYTDTADEGSRVVSVVPKRILDTRPTERILQGSIDAGPLNPFEVVELPIRGVDPVPNDADVTGVIVNLTGVSAQGDTYISMTPDAPPAGEQAKTSNGNFLPGPPRAAMAIVPVGDDGSIYIANGAARVEVLIDVVGYLVEGEASSTQAGRVVPLDSPFRSFDTREIEFGSLRLGQGQWEDWSFSAFADSVQIGGSTGPAQQGFFANLVAFDLQNSGLSFFTLNPRQPSPFAGAPGNSSLNLPVAQAVGNMTLVRYGDNGQGDTKVVSAYNDKGSAHYHLDVYAVILAD